MSEANKAVALEFIQALGVGDAETAKRLMTKDVVAVARGTSVISRSRNYDEIVAVFEMFPMISKTGLNPKIISITAEGDHVAVEWEGYCTLVNGAQYNNQYATVFSFRDGKICKFMEYFCSKLTDEVLVPAWQKLQSNPDASW